MYSLNLLLAVSLFSFELVQLAVDVIDDLVVSSLSSGLGASALFCEIVNPFTSRRP
jgi:hypothetical protein